MASSVELSPRERLQRRQQYRQRRTMLRPVFHLRRSARNAFAKTFNFWAEGKIAQNDPKPYLENSSREEPSTLPPVSKTKKKPLPMSSERDPEQQSTWRILATQPEGRVSWDKTRHELRGTHGAKLTYSPGRSIVATLTADRLVLNQKTGQARAEGNARLERDGKTWSAHYLEYNFRAQQFQVVQFRGTLQNRQMIRARHQADMSPAIQPAQIDVSTDARAVYFNTAQFQEPLPAGCAEDSELQPAKAPKKTEGDGEGPNYPALPKIDSDPAGNLPPLTADSGVLGIEMRNSMWKDRHLRFSFEEIDMPATGENMGLFGVGVHENFNDWLYGGLSAYGAATGQRGGFFTGGFTVGAKKHLGGNWWADAGIYAGAGGGGGAPQGGGLMLRPHIGLMYDFGEFSLGLHYTKVKFPNGDINSDAIAVMLDIPFNSLDRNWDDPPTSAEQYFGNGLANITKHRSHISMRARAYNPASGSKKTSGKNLDETIGLMGVEYAYFLDNNWFMNFEAAGAMKGGVDGYAEFLGGLGYRMPLSSNDRLALLPSVSLGGAGGGGVDTGGGFVTRANLGLEYRLSPRMSLILDGGYLTAPNGNFDSTYAGLNLTYVMETFAADPFGAPIAEDDIVKTSKWRIRPAHQWYFDAQRKTTAARDMQLMGAKIDWIGGDSWYLTGQALSAYAGGAGGYSEGLWGGGVFGPSWKDAQVYAEMLVGAGGGGGVDTGSALLFKPSVGLEYQYSDRLSLQTGLGKVISKSGNLDSNFLEFNLVYRFGAAHR